MTLPAALQRHLRLPVVASPLFIASTPELVVAQCTAGIVGSFPALNARAPDTLAGWLDRIDGGLAAWNRAHPERPAAPYAVNQVVHDSNTRLADDLAVCVAHRVPLVITSLGARREVIDAIHGYGGLVLHDVINNTFARKAVAKGVDGLIAVAAGAGGHAGRVSPFALVQDIREWFDGLLLLGGCIATGDAILAAQACGADMAYIGTPFIATREANADPRHQQAIVDGNSDDIVYTNIFTGTWANFLRAGVEASGLDPDRLHEVEPARMAWSAGGSSQAKAWKDIWSAGQGIAPVKAVLPAADLVARLEREYHAARQRLVRG